MVYSTFLKLWNIGMLQIAKDHLQYPQCSTIDATEHTEETKSNRASMCIMGMRQVTMNGNFAPGFAQKTKLRSNTRSRIQNYGWIAW